MVCFAVSRRKGWTSRAKHILGECQRRGPGWNWNWQRIHWLALMPRAWPRYGRVKACQPQRKGQSDDLTHTVIAKAVMRRGVRLFSFWSCHTLLLPLAVCASHLACSLHRRLFPCPADFVTPRSGARRYKTRLHKLTKSARHQVIGLADAHPVVLAGRSRRLLGSFHEDLERKNPNKYSAFILVPRTS